jgi:hypothetical protein
MVAACTTERTRANEDIVPVEPQTLILEDQSLRLGFVQLPKQILYARNISHVAKLLYAVLLGYAFQEAQCFPGYRRLCEDIQASENMIRKHMRELQAVGLLSQKRRGQGKTNIYILHDLRTAKIEVLEPAKIEVQEPQNVRGNNKQKNNKEKKEEQESIVVAIATELENFGIAKTAAAKLTKRYSVPYIREKLTMAQELVARGSDLVVQNPAGWLRCGIEEDYRPRTLPARQQQRSVRKQKKPLPTYTEPKATATDARQQDMPQKPQPAQTVPTAQREPENSDSTTPEEKKAYEATWEKVVAHVTRDNPQEEVTARLAGTALVAITDTVAWISVATPTAVAWLERRLYGQIAKAIKEASGKDVDLQFIQSEAGISPAGSFGV